MTDDVEGRRPTPASSAAIEALKALGFDIAEADMIYHGDMLGAALGKKVAERLAALQRERDESEATPHRDDIAAASITYMCADCADEESDYSCHPLDRVVIIDGEVICDEHAKRHTGRQIRMPDIPARLRRQRMSIAATQRRAEIAEAKLSALGETP